MLIIMTDEQILSPKQVCQNCLLADTSGLPRWRRGKLGCGCAVSKLHDYQADIYECQMGFRVANIQ